MVKFINALTGTEMFVADDRKEEYMAAGHRLAAVPSAVAKKTETVKEEPKKTSYKAPAKKSVPAKKK